ncbi:unnamed protein product [Peniophora sp. CBMAI 1063]|nr:unnamed protein product [Peniophora sp. CBMAI 1063]
MSDTPNPRTNHLPVVPSRYALDPPEGKGDQGREAHSLGARDLLGGTTTSVHAQSGAQSVLPSTQTAQTRTEHCVRCHRDYDTNARGRESRCQIPHVFREDGQPWGPDIYRFEPKCCDDGGYVLEDGAGNGDYQLKGNARRPCITLKHTTDPKLVDYNDANVVECSEGLEGKCELEWLKMRDTFDTPAFTCNAYC